MPKADANNTSKGLQRHLWILPVTIAGVLFVLVQLSPSSACKYLQIVANSSTPVNNELAIVTKSITSHALKVRSRARMCGLQPVPQFKDWAKYSKSQSHEDQQLYEGFFKGVCGGAYIEMGALDGVRYSNSYFFHKSPLKWKGLLIEAIPANFAQLKDNRKDDELVHAAVCKNEQEVHIVEGTNNKTSAVTGILEFMPPGFKERWWKDLKDTSIDNLPKVKCRSLDAIISDSQSLRQEGANDKIFVDFFSLDVEGGELMVLESIDFNKVEFGIIVVEMDEHNPLKNNALTNMLHIKGYQYLFNVGRSGWFRSNRFSEAYRHLLPS